MFSPGNGRRPIGGSGTVLERSASAAAEVLETATPAETDTPEEPASPAGPTAPIRKEVGPCPICGVTRLGRDHRDEHRPAVRSEPPAF